MNLRAILGRLFVVLAVCVPLKAVFANPLNVRFMARESRDATLVVTPNQTKILLDHGLSKSPHLLISSLKELHLSALDFWVAPRFDSPETLRHILDTYPIHAFLFFEQGSNRIPQDFLDELSTRHIGYQTLSPGQKWDMDLEHGVTLTLLPATQNTADQVDQANTKNDSVLFSLRYGEVSLLFIENEVSQEQEEIYLRDALSLPSTLLKMSHPACPPTIGTRFLNVIAPQIAVISESNPNQPCNKPSPLKEILEKRHIQTFFLNANQEIVLSTDGKTYTLPASLTEASTQQGVAQETPAKGSQRKSSSKKSASSETVTPTSSEQTPSTQQATGFIASKRSKIFHAASCPLAAKIKSDNRVIYNTRNEALASGRRPCKTCQP